MDPATRPATCTTTVQPPVLKYILVSDPHLPHPTLLCVVRKQTEDGRGVGGVSLDYIYICSIRNPDYRHSLLTIFSLMNFVFDDCVPHNIAVVFSVCYVVVSSLLLAVVLNRGIPLARRVRRDTAA